MDYGLQMGFIMGDPAGKINLLLEHNLIYITYCKRRVLCVESLLLYQNYPFQERKIILNNGLLLGVGISLSISLKTNLK